MGRLVWPSSMEAPMRDGENRSRLRFGAAGNPYVAVSKQLLDDARLASKVRRHWYTCSTSTRTASPPFRQREAERSVPHFHLLKNQQYLQDTDKHSRRCLQRE